jgi:hypothetical protein
MVIAQEITMISRCVVAAGLAFATLCVPAYADEQPGTNSASSGNASSTPQVRRGHFPHRKLATKRTNEGLLLGGAAFGAGLIAALAHGGSGGAGIVPPVSGQ